MSVVHFIAMDTHSHSTDICVKTRANRPGRRFRVATTIPAIREVLEGVARPRKLTFEEGPLADWLWRNLQGDVEEAVVCDPRKNAARWPRTGIRMIRSMRRSSAIYSSGDTFGGCIIPRV